jgi:hypothetical protein
MEKLPRQVYTKEFRLQAVEIITRDGLSLTEAAHLPVRRAGGAR